VEQAVEAVLAAGQTVPRDLGGTASCTAMTTAICRQLG
jgi:3-isopropylmalate dehydrogenase